MDTIIFNQTSAHVFAAVFFASLLSAIIWKIILKSAFKNKRKPKYLTPLNIFTLGTFIAIYFLFIDFGDFRSGVDSFKNTINIFKWGLSFDEIFSLAGKTESLNEIGIPHFDKALVSLLFFGTPILTMRAFFSLFKDKFTRSRYYIALLWDCHVFSSLTEKSICLATDIYNESKSFFKPLIIFCNVNTENINDGLLLKAEFINAGCYKKSILDFKTNKIFQGKFFIKLKGNSFYLSSENDAVNERDCVYLTQSDKKIIDHLYVFSSSENSDRIINTAKKLVDYPVHLVNEAQIIAYSLLFEHPMYESANNGKNSVLVVGAGKTGLEIAKNSMWCGSMASLNYKLRIVDKNDKMKELKAKYGDFKKEAKDAGIELDCDCLPINVDLDGLDDVVQNNEDATYIVVALGNDELTLNTAILLRKLYSRISISKKSDYLPKIIPILKSNNYKKIVDSAKEFDLTPFGFHENIYSCDTINNWEIENIACELNKKYNVAAGYGNKDDYDKLPEIERLSNRAIAVHSKYKVYDTGFSVIKNECGNFVLSKREKEQSFTIEEQQKNEHNRWVLFMILNGWKTMSLETAIKRKKSGEEYPQKDYSTETHACIIKNENLKKLAEDLEYKSDKYTKYDIVIVKNTPIFLVDTLNIKANSKEKN